MSDVSPQFYVQWLEADAPVIRKVAMRHKILSNHHDKPDNPLAGNDDDYGEKQQPRDTNSQGAREEIRNDMRKKTCIGCDGYFLFFIGFIVSHSRYDA